MATKEYEILDDQGKVINTIVAELSFVQAVYPGHFREVTPLPTPPKVKWITKYAFRNRFTQTEKEDLELAAAHNPSDTAANKRQASRIRLWMEDIRAADYINLESTRIINGVNAMETAGIIGTGRAAQILSTTIGDDEEYIPLIGVAR